jgi:site-specific DNA-methyltransferase (adenine-specific)
MAEIKDYSKFIHCAKAGKDERIYCNHPTVKPVKLIQHLARMITPPGGVILDCFAGSGTLASAAIIEGFRAILIEREDEYITDIRRRVLIEEQAKIDDAKLI